VREGKEKEGNKGEKEGNGRKERAWHTAAALGLAKPRAGPVCDEPRLCSGRRRAYER